ncbi:MAG: PD-(D/E)XK nuclease family protein [Pseudobutyrivibrio sp.]|nr:PD-(D/E)XK nuclease family protein [Pseudobutyrivibrio sp.]
MNWKQHSELKGTHAPLGASNYHWLTDDESKLKDRYINLLAKEKGTKLHELAEQMILMRVKAENNTKTFNMYVNDAIGFDMKPEQVLYYSDNIYGTADAIKFSGNLLRIHDLKTGTKPASELQLYIYAALFCLEANKKPGKIDMELRIYQNDDIKVFQPTADIIAPIMDKIVWADKVIEAIKGEIG